MQRFLNDQRGLALLEFWMVLPFMVFLVIAGAEMARFILIKQKFEKASYMIASIASQQNPAVKNQDGTLSGLNQDELKENVFPNYLVAMSPFGINDASVDQMGIILTSLYRDPVTNRVLVQWQTSYIPPGVTSDFDWQSSLTLLYVRETIGQRNLCTPSCQPPKGLADGVDAFPLPLTDEERANINAMTPEEGMVVVEMLYYYRPLLTSILAGLINSDGTLFGWTMPEKKLINHIYVMPRLGPLLYLPPHFPVP